MKKPAAKVEAASLQQRRSTSQEDKTVEATGCSRWGCWVWSFESFEKVSCNSFGRSAPYGSGSWTFTPTRCSRWKREPQERWHGQQRASQCGPVLQGYYWQLGGRIFWEQLDGFRHLVCFHHLPFSFPFSSTLTLSQLGRCLSSCDRQGTWRARFGEKLSSFQKLQKRYLGGSWEQK